MRRWTVFAILLACGVIILARAATTDHDPTYYLNHINPKYMVSSTTSRSGTP